VTQRHVKKEKNNESNIINFFAGTKENQKATGEKQNQD
jgi:hypothetical protein